MDTWEDVAREEFINDLYNEFARDVLSGRDVDLYGQVIDQFTSERLQSFYVENPKVAAPGLWALDEARALVASHPAAAMVFAVTATEVGLKATLLKPILHGLVHTDSVAAFIAELVPEQRNDKFRDLLFAILNEYGGIDLRSFRRSGHTETLWEQIAEAQKCRNAALHRAEQVVRSDAERAVEIAMTVLEELFPTVLSKLGIAHPRPAGGMWEAALAPAPRLRPVVIRRTTNPPRQPPPPTPGGATRRPLTFKRIDPSPANPSHTIRRSRASRPSPLTSLGS